MASHNDNLAITITITNTSRNGIEEITARNGNAVEALAQQLAKQSVGSSLAVSPEPPVRRKSFYCDTCKRVFNSSQSYAGHYKKCTTGRGHPHYRNPKFSWAKKKPAIQEGSTGKEDAYVRLMGVNIPTNVKQGDGSVSDPGQLEELKLSLKRFYVR